jgi:hypothetical protein
MDVGLIALIAGLLALALLIAFSARAGWFKADPRSRRDSQDLLRDVGWRLALGLIVGAVAFVLLLAAMGEAGLQLMTILTAVSLLAAPALYARARAQRDGSSE